MAEPLGLFLHLTKLTWGEAKWEPLALLRWQEAPGLGGGWWASREGWGACSEPQGTPGSAQWPLVVVLLPECPLPGT